LIIGGGPGARIWTKFGSGPAKGKIRKKNKQGGRTKGHNRGRLGDQGTATNRERRNFKKKRLESNTSAVSKQEKETARMDGRGTALDYAKLTKS